MKKINVIIAMYEAMDCFYDESEKVPENLEQFLRDLNPYVWKGHITADPAIQASFDRYSEDLLAGDDVDPNVAYDVVKGFLKEQSDYYSEVFPEGKSLPFDVLFSYFTLEEWNDLCNFIEQEESNS